MRLALAVTCLAALACQGTPHDAAGWARAAVKRNRVQEKLEALEQARRAPGDRKAATPALVSLLKEGGKVRAAAALALGEFGDPAAVQPLLAAVDLSYGGVRVAETHEANRRVAEALGKLRAREAVPVLIQLTSSPDGFTQVAAVDALGDVGDPAAVEKLMAIATSDDAEPFTSKKALLSLGKIGDARAVPAVVKMLFRERRGATFFPEASVAASAIGAPAVEPLLAALEGRDQALQAWARSAGVVEGALRAKAAQVLGDLGDPRAVPPLLKTLAWTDRFADLQLLVRVYSAESLGRLRAREAVGPLGEALGREKDPNARDRYADALARIGDPRAIPALARAAQARTWDERSGALEAVSRLGGAGELRLVEQGADSAHAPEVARMKARLAAAQGCREDLGCWKEKLSAEAAVRDRAALEVGRRGGPADAAGLMEAAALPVQDEADLAARYHALLGMEWVTARDVPGAPALADRLDALADKEKGRGFTAKVNEDARRIAMKLRRGARAP
ncbi:MAG TPA: HEAT repeat domain-containing protein [Anaeromyxobacteraceae bacterium]|nr:HEAT repeat domain-containing protein [Anaeromyxobacteraceae bacterium]